jgi:peptidoglycan hydrolase CwlO-like protein
MFKRVRVAVRQATKDTQTPWEESSLIVNFALFTAANPAPLLDKVKNAAVVELAELGKASQCEQELQDQIVEFEKQMDDVDDDGSDVNEKRIGQLRRQIKKLKAELAELKKLPSSSR